MLQLTFVFLGVVAVLASGATMNVRLDVPTRIMTGAFSTFAWLYWSISALSVQPATSDLETAGDAVLAGTGLVDPVGYLGLTAIGLAAAAVLLLSTARLAFGSIGTTYNEQTQFES